MAKAHTNAHTSVTDYSAHDSWMHLPDPIKDADAFFVYPTVYISDDNDQEFAPIDGFLHRISALAVYEKIASPFMESCNVFAPYYQQGAMDIIAQMRGEELVDYLSGVPALDIFAALDYYFEHYNQGRPFFLIGHSQGSTLIKLILRDYMQRHPEYFERMVAAYAIGFSFSHEEELVYPCIKLAQRADDVGVVITWNTESPDNKGHDNMVVTPDSACINPLSWTCDNRHVSAQENKGSRLDSLSSTLDAFRATYDPESFDASRSLQDVVSELIADVFTTVKPGIADAQIETERGVVMCTTPGIPFSQSDDPRFKNCFGPASYHGLDIALYWYNIQENVRTRLAAYKRVRTDG